MKEQSSLTGTASVVDDYYDGIFFGAASERVNTLDLAALDIPSIDLYI